MSINLLYEFILHLHAISNSKLGDGVGTTGENNEVLSVKSLFSLYIKVVVIPALSFARFLV